MFKFLRRLHAFIYSSKLLKKGMLKLFFELKIFECDLKIISLRLKIRKILINIVVAFSKVDFMIIQL